MLIRILASVVCLSTIITSTITKNCLYALYSLEFVLRVNMQAYHALLSHCTKYIQLDTRVTTLLHSLLYYVTWVLVNQFPQHRSTNKGGKLSRDSLLINLCAEYF